MPAASAARENVIGDCSTGDRMKTWGQMGASWGGMWRRGEFLVIAHGTSAGAAKAKSILAIARAL